MNRHARRAARATARDQMIDRAVAVPNSTSLQTMWATRGTMSMMDSLSVGERLLLCNSYARTFELFDTMIEAPTPEERVRLFLEWWNACDDPWAWRSCLAGVLRAALRDVCLRDLLQAPERAWFDALDPVILVYRGCEAGRERGLSWTTDVEVAKHCARGQRVKNMRPTLVSAHIPKVHVLGVFLSRKESEVVVDPRRLRRLTALEPPAPWDPEDFYAPPHKREARKRTGVLGTAA